MESPAVYLRTKTFARNPLTDFCAISVAEASKPTVTRSIGRCPYATSPRTPAVQHEPLAQGRFDLCRRSLFVSGRQRESYGGLIRKGYELSDLLVRQRSYLGL